MEWGKRRLGRHEEEIVTPSQEALDWGYFDDILIMRVVVGGTDYESNG